MTANELQEYLKQVVDVESNVISLRASYDILKYHDWYYKTVGTDADYSVSDRIFKKEVPTVERILSYNYGDKYRDVRFESDNQIKNVMESPSEWLRYSDASGEIYEMEENFDEIFPDYSGYSRLSSFDVNDIARIDNQVKKDLFNKNYRMPAIIKDPMPALDKVEEPKKVDEPKRIGKGMRIFTYVVMLCAGVHFGSLFGGLIGAIIGAMIMLLIAFAMVASQDKKVTEYDAYLERKKAYDEYVRKNEENENIDQYATTKANFMKACDRAFGIAAKEYKEFAVKRNRTIEAEISKLEKQIQESEGVLNKLYAMNVLHPKYRNLAAASTILEYIETGRCSELTGHEGAYNLYESELRQNLIIAKLDVVIQKLDELKATMYRCCMAVENVGKQIQGLDKELKTLNTTAAKQLAVQTETLKFTALNATYSAAIAANTEAIKYLTLIQ